MKRCWASAYSECSNKISREHIVSNGVFEQKSIFVRGFPWCKGKEKKISVANLTSKILCIKHNNELTDIDKEGINAIRLFEQNLPSDIKSNKIPPQREYINGYNFERWLLKTAINLSFETNLHIGVGMTDSKIGCPSSYLLSVVYGKYNFTHKMGLYLIPNKSPVKYRKGAIFVFPIHKEQAIGGYFFHIRGLNFFLSLHPGKPNDNMLSLGSLGLGEKSLLPNELLNALPIYRPDSINCEIFNFESIQINFSW